MTHPAQNFAARPSSRSPFPGAVEVTGRANGYDEGPQGQNRIFHLEEWGKWSHKQRVAYLRGLVSEYASDARIRQLAARILASQRVEQRDYPAQCAALLHWVQMNVRYLEERDEQIQTPWKTVELRLGDCDDHALLLASLAESIRLPCKFVLLGQHKKSGKMVRWVEGHGAPPKNTNYFHIYNEFAWPGSGPMKKATGEATIKGAPLGFDIGYHGLNVDGHGRPSLPSAVVRAGRANNGIFPEGIRDVKGPGMGGRALGGILIAKTGGNDLGSYGSAFSEDEAPLKAFFSANFWQSLVVESFGSVVGAVSIYYVMKWVEKREERRKKNPSRRRRNGRIQSRPTKRIRKSMRGRRR